MKTPCAILLIEDSRNQALQLKLLIERALGCQVYVVSDGIEGWRQACQDIPRIIFLDINLPSLDGFQILNRLKRNRDTATIPVVMLTERERVADVEQAISLGADGYIFKEDFLFASTNQLFDTIGHLVIKLETQIEERCTMEQRSPQD